MTKDEIGRYREFAIDLLAKEQARAFRRPLQEMQEVVTRTFLALLPPSGVVDAGDHLCIIKSEGREIGFVWFTTPESSKVVYVRDFYLHPHLRGRGLGKRAFRELEQHVRKLGREWISLNVFEHNDVGRRMYEALEFRAAAIAMAKDLGTLRSPSESSEEETVWPASTD